MVMLRPIGQFLGGFDGERMRPKGCVVLVSVGGAVALSLEKGREASFPFVAYSFCGLWFLYIIGCIPEPHSCDVDRD